MSARDQDEDDAGSSQQPTHSQGVSRAHLEVPAWSAAGAVGPAWSSAGEVERLAAV